MSLTHTLIGQCRRGLDKQRTKAFVATGNGRIPFCYSCKAAIHLWRNQTVTSNSQLRKIGRSRPDPRARIISYFAQFCQHRWIGTARKRNVAFCFAEPLNLAQLVQQNMVYKNSMKLRTEGILVGNS